MVTQVIQFKDGLFTCPRQPGNLRLTANSCATSYQRGKRAQQWESAYLCRGCQIGAKHAGEEPVQAEPKIPCRLCNRPKSHKKVVYGCICISCYNRLTETFRGSNAKGREPRKLVGQRAFDTVIVGGQGVTFVGYNGRLAYIARAPGRLPLAQQSLF